MENKTPWIALLKLGLNKLMICVIDWRWERCHVWLIKWASFWENRSSGFPTRSDTNRAAQPQKMDRVLKISDLGSRGIVLSV